MTQVGLFAEALEDLRLSRGLTPAQLARELGEYEGNVSRWRRGGGIEVAKVRKIADYFGVSRRWLESLAGYPESPNDITSADGDPRKMERFALVEQIADEDWPSVRKMLVGLAAVTTPDGGSNNGRGARVNIRKRAHTPPMESQKDGWRTLPHLVLSYFTLRPRPTPIAATA